MHPKNVTALDVTLKYGHVEYEEWVQQNQGKFNWKQNSFTDIPTFWSQEFELDLTDAFMSCSTNAWELFPKILSEDHRHDATKKILALMQLNISRALSRFIVEVN